MVGSSVLIFLLSTIALICPCEVCEASNWQSNVNNSSLHIMLFNISDRECSSDIVNSAVEHAVGYLNSQPDILSEFTINLTVVHCGTMCGLQDVQDVFFNELFKSPNELAIVGPACTGASNAIAQMSKHYQIPMVSLAPSITNNKAPYFFSLVPSQVELLDGIVNFVKAFPTWGRVAIISQDKEMFRIMSVYLETTFSTKNISVNSSKVVSRVLPLQNITMEMLLTNSARIVILNMDSEHTLAVLCKASRVRQPKPYVWIIPSVYEKQWWSTDESEDDCDNNQLQRFLTDQGVITVSSTPKNCTTGNLVDCNSTSVTVAGYASVNEPLQHLAYDAVISIGLGLNATVTKNSTHLIDDISEKPGSVRQVGSTLSDSIADSSFHGMSGHVCFKNSERVVSTLRILQFREDTTNQSINLKEVGVLYVWGGLEFADSESNATLWQNGIPSDGTPVTEEKYPIMVLTVVAYTFAVFNIAMALVCIIFMIVFRKKRLIRLSSPNLNYLIGVGVIVFSISAFLFIYPPLPRTTIDVFCGVRPWFVSIGYSLTLGTINTKMWRVYYIFRNPKATSKKKPLKDWHLFSFVGLFLLIDLVILTAASSFPTSRLQAEAGPDLEHTDGDFNEDGIKVNYIVTTCESKYKLYWLFFLFGYKIIIQVVGVILAFRIRKVKVKVLNDSKEVTLILYLTGIVLATVMTITFGFGKYLNVYAGSYVFGISSTSSVILGVVFISKAIQLKKDPDGERIFTQGKDANTAVSALATCDENKVTTLQKKVRHLEAQLTYFSHDTVDCADNDFVTSTNERNIDQTNPTQTQLEILSHPHSE